MCPARENPLVQQMGCSAITSIGFGFDITNKLAPSLVQVALDTGELAAILAVSEREAADALDAGALAAILAVSEREAADFRAMCSRDLLHNRTVRLRSSRSRKRPPSGSEHSTRLAMSCSSRRPWHACSCSRIARADDVCTVEYHVRRDPLGNWQC
jgi:hypothetical protein